MLGKEVKISEKYETEYVFGYDYINKSRKVNYIKEKSSNVIKNRTDSKKY